MGVYVTAAMLREHSRIDSSAATDGYLDHIAGAAEAAVARVLQRDSLSEVAYDNGLLPEDVLHCVMMLAATLYENRESEAPVDMRPSPAFVSMLKPYKKYKG